MKLYDYFYIYYENPFKTYNKVKKYFKSIKPKFSWGFGKRNKAKILELCIYDLMWKDKYNSPRHEFNPRILLSLFNYIHLYIDFTLGDSMTDMVYWEAIIDWVYYGKDLQEACTNGWSYWDKETNQYEHLSFSLLKEPYQTAFNSYALNNWYYEGTT